MSDSIKNVVSGLPALEQNPRNGTCALGDDLCQLATRFDPVVTMNSLAVQTGKNLNDLTDDDVDQNTSGLDLAQRNSIKQNLKSLRELFKAPTTVKAAPLTSS